MTLGSLKANADYNDEQSYTRYVNKRLFYEEDDSLGRFYLNAGLRCEVTTAPSLKISVLISQQPAHLR